MGIQQVFFGFGGGAVALPAPKFFYGHENYASGDGTLVTPSAAVQPTGNKLALLGLVYSGGYYLHAYQLDPYTGSTLTNRRLASTALSYTSYSQLAVTAAADDTNYVAVTPATGPVLLVSRYNAEFTSLTWQRQFTATGYVGQDPVLTTDASGNVYAACLAYKSTNPFILVAKWNNAGTLQWSEKLSTTYGLAYGDLGRLTGLVVDSVGNVYVSMSLCYDNTGTYRYMGVFKLNSSGGLVAQRFWRESTSSYTSYSFGLSLHTDGYLYHVGACPTVAKLDTSLNIVGAYYAVPGIYLPNNVRTFVTQAGQVIWTVPGGDTSLLLYSVPTTLSGNSAYSITVPSGSSIPAIFLGGLHQSADHIFLPVYWHRGTSIPCGVFGLKADLATNAGSHSPYTFSAATAMSGTSLSLIQITSLFSTYTPTVSESAASFFSSSAQTTCTFDLVST